MARLSKLKPGERSNHFTHDYIIEIHGNRATLNAQFLVARAQVEAAAAGAVGAQRNVSTVLTVIRTRC
jgi:hypothetical protein